MKKIMQAMKIWTNNPDTIDEYVDFKSEFSCTAGEKIFLDISCDNVFNVYLNGENAGFGSCQNFIGSLQYYTFDITRLCKEHNDLAFTVWHFGEDSSTYIKQPAYLMFRVRQGENILLTSDKNVLCAPNPNFKSGRAQQITVQLGFGFYYDNSVSGERNFVPSSEYSEAEAEYNNILNLKMLKRSTAKIKKTEYGYLIDMKKETVGFLDLELNTTEEEEILVCYGERLDENGRVPRIIENRDFSLFYKSCKGANAYVNTFRRIAGRYLEIHTKSAELVYAGIRPVMYPSVIVEKSIPDKTLQKIYDISVYTLRCCMHEHYEDCPWREQALYALDSRNQMLCGYYAFRGYQFQRASLVLLAKGLLDNGLLNICAPAGFVKPIPSFSLIYPVQVYEYITYSGDKSILNEVGDALHAIMKTFASAIDETGLIPDFEDPCWNFYEWSDHNDYLPAKVEIGGTEVKNYDLILNCMYVYAAGYYDKIFRISTDTTAIKKAIKANFFVEGKQEFKLSTTGEEHFGMLGNAFAILAGVGSKALAEKLINDKTLIPATLSMNAFVYDALLQSGNQYKEYILTDIKTRYNRMIARGATTFWETEKGAEDFNNAGSLCHGWSAMPVFYLNELID